MSTEEPQDSSSSRGSISPLPSPVNNTKDPDFLPPDEDGNPPVFAPTTSVKTPPPAEYDQKLVSTFLKCKSGALYNIFRMFILFSAHYVLRFIFVFLSYISVKKKHLLVGSWSSQKIWISSPKNWDFFSFHQHPRKQEDAHITIEGHTPRPFTPKERKKKTSFSLSVRYKFFCPSLINNYVACLYFP